jgi:uncharacterized protein (TIGR03083 family)
MPTTVLDREQIWHSIDAQRAAVADLLDTLSPDEWRRPSLCTRWSVRQVAAHLTLQELGVRDLPAVLSIMVRARGDFDRAVHEMATARAAELDDAQLVALIRGMVGSRRHNLGVTYLETLTDMLVHGQDIAVPLDRRLDMPPAAAAVAATRMCTMRWPPPFPIRKTLRHFRLRATDTDWAAGDGPLVEGPMSALLLLTCGRPAALPHLMGPGLPTLRSLLQPHFDAGSGRRC